MTIEFQPNGPIQVTANRTGQTETLDVDRFDITRARTDIADDLATFKKSLGSLRVPPQKRLDAAFRHLFERMSVVVEALEPDGAEGLERVRILFTGAYPRWQAPGKDVPVVDVIGFEDGFPLELLPVFDFGDLPSRIDPTNVEAVSRRFLGFVAAVRRIQRPRRTTDTATAGQAGLPQPRRLEMRPKLKITLFHNSSLAGAKAERSFFDQRTDIDLDGPWPTTPVTIEAAIGAVTDALFDPTRRVGSTRRDRATSIHHFACHCETPTANPAEHKFILAGDDGDERPVRLGRLVTGYNARQKGQPPRTEPRSLVFLNACGSAALHPLRATDFPSFFLKNKHLGFIGTETNVPDDIAALFSEEFYTRLLRGRPIGESVVLARRELVRKWANPIGIVYALYADPDIRVQEEAGATQDATTHSPSEANSPTNWIT